MIKEYFNTRKGNMYVLEKEIYTRDEAEEMFDELEKRLFPECTYEAVRKKNIELIKQKASFLKKIEELETQLAELAEQKRLEAGECEIFKR